MQNLSVLVIHNRYQQPGGEDAVVAAEVELLRGNGHRAVEYRRDNRDIRRYGPFRRAELFFSTTWDRRTYSDLRELIRRERPDVAHCHNFLPLVSPAAYYACKAGGVPVVQTLHNYRLVCPAATLFRRRERCTACIGGAGRAIPRACYRGSALQTATVSAMIAVHRRVGTWQRMVDCYLTPSAFCRELFVRAGLPEGKIQVKPNFLLHDPGKRTEHGDYALFVGRLSPEKGVMEMLEGWKQLADIPLRIVGDGPLMQAVQDNATEIGDSVKLLGHLRSEQTAEQIRRARFLVFPSRWHEPFGMALLEAAACGVPAVASRVGAVPELVVDGRTGLLFDADDSDDFTRRIRWAWSHPEQMEQMGDAARQLYLQRFTAETNYRMLMQIYDGVVRNHHCASAEFSNSISTTKQEVSQHELSHSCLS